MNLMPFLLLLAVLAMTVLVLLVWRKTVARNEDDNLHVMDGAAVRQTAQQAVVAQKLDLIDKWGKILTIVTVIYGAIVGGLYMYQTFVQNSRIGV
jgi:uncharacterized membrane-anchored protein